MIAEPKSGISRILDITYSLERRFEPQISVAVP